MNIPFLTSPTVKCSHLLYSISMVGTNWPQVEPRWALETWADAQASRAAVSTQLLCAAASHQIKATTVEAVLKLQPERVIAAILNQLTVPNRSGINNDVQ